MTSKQEANFFIGVKIFLFVWAMVGLAVAVKYCMGPALPPTHDFDEPRVAFHFTKVRLDDGPVSPKEGHIGGNDTTVYVTTLGLFKGTWYDKNAFLSVTANKRAHIVCYQDSVQVFLHFTGGEGEDYIDTYYK